MTKDIPVDDTGPSAHGSPMPLAEARQRIVSRISPVEGHETVELRAALNRVLAETVRSSIDVPGADNASMDGYALCMPEHVGNGSAFEVIGQSFAGHPYDGPLAPGQAVRIMTGAVVPRGASAVVMQENTVRQAGEDHVAVDPLPPVGENIRPAGEDLGRGDVVLAAGKHLTPADVALLASVGAHRVSVRRRPRVAFFSTGDELRPIDGPLQPGEIYDSNRQGLAASLMDLGMEIQDLGAVPDDPEALAEAFSQAAEYDALVTSGGVSVGDADFVLDVLGRQGEVDFWRVAIKPGKPLAFGTLGNAWFFGLPGNPVSTAVTFIQLVRPALVRLAGGMPAPPLRFSLPTTTGLTKRPGREHYLRAAMDFSSARPVVTAVEHQGSGVMRSMSRADAFIVLPADSSGVEAGNEVTVEPFAQPIWALPDNG